MADQTETNNQPQAAPGGATCPCSTIDILEHWMAHRRLTRKLIEAFPAEHLFTFSVGGMRPFGELVHEFLGMGLPVANQLASGTWSDPEPEKPTDKAGLLARWDAHMQKIRTVVAGVPAERFRVRFKMYEQYEVTGLEAVQYAVDNEIHHRGQGYVYLRALGIEPPAFYDRA